MKNTYIADMVKGFLTDSEIMTDKVAEQIRKALKINSHLTSCYKLQVSEVQDILGADSRTSGWYLVLSGTRCGVRFFINNDLEITRKPNKNTVKVKATYDLTNQSDFSEGFWGKYF